MKKLNRKQVLNVILETLLKEEIKESEAKSEINKMNLPDDVKEIVNQYYSDPGMSLANTYLETIKLNFIKKKDREIENKAYEKLALLVSKYPGSKQKILESFAKMKTELSNQKKEYKPLDLKSKDYQSFAKLVKGK